MAKNYVDASSTPWIINPIFAYRVIQPNPDGSHPFNYAWIDDFKALQQQ